MLIAFFMVCLPLPDWASTIRNTWQDHLNLIPFKQIWLYWHDKAFGIAALKEYLVIMSLWQLLFNILLTVPFGIYMRYYFNLSLKRTILYSFLLSLFYETSQITALFGIYAGPYRLADVEDLICNTLGGAGGYYMASTFARVLPSRDEIDERCKAHGTRVTGMRRFWAVLFDYLCIDALYLFVTGAIRIINPEFTGLSMYAEVDSWSFFCAFSLVMVLVTRGSTLAVVLYMMLFAKSELLKSIGRIGILPGLFNINEPVTFGLPIVLNPVLMVPYILAPIAAMTVQYVGTAAGLFPLCNNMVPWTTPVLISGFLTTGSFMGVVAQLCGLAAAMAVWLPFIRAYDKKCYREEQGLAA